MKMRPDWVLDPYSVKDWPLLYRRLFLVLLPVTGPLWLLWLGTVIVLCIAAGVILAPVVGVWSLWEKKQHDLRPPV